MPSPLSLCCKCDHKPKLTTLENGSGDGDPWFTYTCRNCENTSDEYDGTKYEARIRWNDEQEKGRLASGKPGVPPVSAATTQPSMLEQYVLTRAPTREELLNHTSKKWMVKLKAFSQWMEALVQHPSAYSPGEITEADADYLAMFLCDGSGGTMALNPESIEMSEPYCGDQLMASARRTAPRMRPGFLGTETSFRVSPTSKILPCESSSTGVISSPALPSRSRKYPPPR